METEKYKITITKIRKHVSYRGIYQLWDSAMELNSERLILESLLEK